MNNDIFDKFAPAGHFYSPLPDINEVERKKDILFDRSRQVLGGINIDDDKQMQLLENLSQYYKQIPFSEETKEELRYYYGNGAYDQGDAIILHSMIRYWQPKKIMEIGSGFSSAAILDTNELFFDNQIECTFIEPYPEVLNSVLKDRDKGSNKIITKSVQDVELSLFHQLDENDICFIDSTHVAKIGSDVNHLIFNVLPLLNDGVIIHFHDIFYPFEYPKEWIYSGRAWNENYILRAFLEYNDKFEILLFNDYIGRFFKDEFIQKIPDFFVNPGGSLWLRKK